MQRKELLKRSSIRYAEYYGMVEVQDALYRDSAEKKIFNSMKDKLLCVAGNCDSDVDTLVLEFPIGAEYCILPLENGRTESGA